MEQESIKDLKPLARRRKQFDNQLLRVKNAGTRLSLVHQQMDWCYAIISTHDHDDWSKYCHDWLSVLHDGLDSVA